MGVQNVGRRSWRRGQTAGGSIPRWSTGKPEVVTRRKATGAGKKKTKLETKVIEFISKWLVTLLMPAKHVLETRLPHLSFMLKEYSFRKLYLGLKVTASFDRTEL